MKSILFFLLVGSAIAGEPVKVASFGQFKDVEFTKIEGDFVKFFHKNGIDSVLITDLPPDLRKKVADLPKVDMVQKRRQEAVGLLQNYRIALGGELHGKIFQVIEGGILVTPKEFVFFKPKYNKVVDVQKIYELGSANFGRPAYYQTIEVESYNRVKNNYVFRKDEMVFVHCDTKNLKSLLKNPGNADLYFRNSLIING